MFVTVFLGYNQYWLGGLIVFVVYVQEHPKAQKTGPHLKSHLTDLERPGIEPATPGLQGIGFSPTPRLKSDVPSALSLGRLFQQFTSQISETLMRYAKKLQVFIYCSYKMNKF